VAAHDLSKPLHDLSKPFEGSDQTASEPMRSIVLMAGLIIHSVFCIRMNIRMLVPRRLRLRSRHESLQHNGCQAFQSHAAARFSVMRVHTGCGSLNPTIKSWIARFTVKRYIITSLYALPSCIAGIPGGVI
jgi:hypothetical protein